MTRNKKLIIKKMFKTFALAAIIAAVQAVEVEAEWWAPEPKK